MRAINGQPVLAAMPTEQPTQVIASDPMTTTARRGVVPVTAPLSPAASPAAADTDLMEPEKKSNKGVIALAIIAGLIVIAMGVAISTILNPPEPPSTATVQVPTTVGQTEVAATEHPHRRPAGAQRDVPGGHRGQRWPGAELEPAGGGHDGGARVDG